MTDKELLEVVDNIGWEQILLDADLTVDTVMLLIHELGYIDLEIYQGEDYDNEGGY